MIWLVIALLLFSLLVLSRGTRQRRKDRRDFGTLRRHEHARSIMRHWPK